MKVFVTGATGFLGRHVTRDLLDNGHAVRAMVRKASGHDRRIEAGAETVEAGFDGSLEDLARAVEGCDGVLHLAGKVSRDPADASEMHWIHVEATAKLLDAMESAGVRRMVLASTSGTIAVHKEPGRISTEADTPLLETLGRWPYYLSKKFQEEEVLRRNNDDRLEAVVLNPSLLLGPGDERISSTGDVLKVLHGRIPAITSGTVAFVDARDCAPAFRRALESGGRGERYLLNGANMSVRSFCDRVALAGGVRGPQLKLPDRWARLGAKVIEGVYKAVDRVPPVDAVSVDISSYHWGCSSKKAERELGFTPRDPQATIEETVRYLEKRGVFRRT